MKFYNKIILTGFILTVAFSAFGFSAKSESISEKLIRMHVLANSDSEFDQRVKLKVKDEVAVYTEKVISNSSSLEQAQEELEISLEVIEEIAEKTLEKYDVGYEAEVYLKEEYFPTRVYEDFTLPAGDYLAVKVMLGEAIGQNWWCVVYPSLCVGSATETDYEVFSESEKDLILETPKISFKIYEIFLDIKNKLKEM